MQQLDFTILQNNSIARGVYELRLTCEGPMQAPLPGQFVNLQVRGHYLRRPVSVCDWQDGTLTLVYKVVGEGTAQLAAYLPGQRINALTGLGNGYTLPPAAAQPDPPPCLLLGGGAGVPPLYYLAKKLLQAGHRPVALLGFNTKEEVFYREAFARLCETHVTTVDGTAGQKGYVTQAAPAAGTLNAAAWLFACGPEPMLRAAHALAAPLEPGHAQLSFERRMGCGFGACMVCSCKTVAGYKRICTDGPILTKEEILWT